MRRTAPASSNPPLVKIFRNISYDSPLLKQRLRVLFETERQAQLAEISFRARSAPGAGCWTRFWFRMSGDGTFSGFCDEFAEWILQRRKRVLDIYLPSSLAAACFDADPAFQAAAQDVMRSPTPQVEGLPPLPMGRWGLTALPPTASAAAAAAAASSAAAARAGAYPVVIHCHGGSWQRGSQANEWRGSPSVCRAVAAAGGIAVAVAYRLSDPPLAQIVLRGLVLYVLIFPLVALTAFIAGGFSASAIPNPALALAASVALMLVVGAVLSFASGRVSHPTHVNDLADAVAWTHEFLGDLFIQPTGPAGGSSSLQQQQLQQQQQQQQHQQQHQQQQPPQKDPLQGKVHRTVSRFVLSGHSAGGHLAMLVAVDPQYLDAAVGRIKALRASERVQASAAGESPGVCGVEARDDAHRGPTAAAATALATLRTYPSSNSLPAAAAASAAAAAAAAATAGARGSAEESPAAASLSPLLEGAGDAVRGAMVGVVGISGVYSVHKPVRNYIYMKSLSFLYFLVFVQL